MQWALFGDLPPEELRQVLSIARRRVFDRGEIVFHEGDPADTLHLIAKGRFAVRIRTAVGDRVTVAIRVPGEAFGELALVGRDPAPRSATVAALEAGETHSVHRSDFDRLRRLRHQKASPPRHPRARRLSLPAYRHPASGRRHAVLPVWERPCQPHGTDLKANALP